MEQKYTSLPCIFGMVTAACTYEGENTVLLFQIARSLLLLAFVPWRHLFFFSRYLVKAYGQAAEGEQLHPSFSYLYQHLSSDHLDHLSSDHLEQTKKKNTISCHAAEEDRPSHNRLISNENFARLFEQVELSYCSQLHIVNYKFAVGEARG